MNAAPATSDQELALRIARLVQERGWSTEHFARVSGLSRQTVHQILKPRGPHRLHNGSVSACARALGLTVNELRTLTLDRLLPRMAVLAGSENMVRRLYEEASQPELLAWIDRNPQRAARLDRDELDELLSLQGTGGPLTSFGVEHFVDLLERRRRLVEKVQTVANTEYLDVVEQFVELLYEKVQPFRTEK